MKKFFFGIGFCVLLFTISCESDDPTGPITTIEFSKHIQPILDEYRDILIIAGVLPEDFLMNSWDNLIKGWRRGEAIIPFDSENSLLIELTTKLNYENKLSPEDLDLLVRWIDAGAENDAGESPFENSTDLLFVCDQTEAKVSIIDSKAFVVIRTVDLQKLGHSITSTPHHIAVEPDGSAWYLSLIGENKILKFSDDHQFLAEADMEDPALLAAHPGNGLLYISRFPQAPDPIPERIGVIERATMTVQADIPVRPTPHAMAVDHTGDFIYSCSLSQSELLTIDAATGNVDILSLGASKGPLQLAVSPDDQTLFISAQLSGEMLVVDVSDPANRTIVNTIPVNATPWHPVFNQDGSRVYVGNSGANTVSVIETATGSVTTIGDGTGADGIAQPHGIAISADGRFVFVSCRNTSGDYVPRFAFGDNELIGTVVVIATATNTIHKVIEIEDFGSGMAIRGNIN